MLKESYAFIQRLGYDAELEMIQMTGVSSKGKKGKPSSDTDEGSAECLSLKGHKINGENS